METSDIGKVAIPDKMFFKIRDVAKIVNVKPHVLRYWESEFPSLSPQKNKNGQRMYTRKDVEMAAEICRLLHQERYSIAGAIARLKKRKSSPQKEVEGSSETLLSVRKGLVGLLDILIKSP